MSIIVKKELICMKNNTRKIVVLNNIDSPRIEQAIFILKEDASRLDESAAVVNGKEFGVACAALELFAVLIALVLDLDNIGLLDGAFLDPYKADDPLEVVVVGVEYKGLQGTLVIADGGR